VPSLFKYEGVKCFLSERLSQDPLEKYFGKQRQCGGSNDNPNVKQFLENAAALRMVNSVALDPVRGNIIASNKEVKIDETPISKRKAKSRRIQ
jgi:hypothetical protein